VHGSLALRALVETGGAAGAAVGVGAGMCRCGLALALVFVLLKGVIGVLGVLTPKAYQGAHPSSQRFHS
jgi:hypothetical protein